MFNEPTMAAASHSLLVNAGERGNPVEGVARKHFSCTGLVFSVRSGHARLIELRLGQTKLRSFDESPACTSLSEYSPKSSNIVHAVKRPAAVGLGSSSEGCESNLEQRGASAVWRSCLQLHVAALHGGAARPRLGLSCARPLGRVA